MFQLSQEQFKSAVDLISPHVSTTPEDRQAFITRALFGSKVMDQLSWTGKPSTFATNLVRQLHLFDGTTSLVKVLETLHDDLGEPHQTHIRAFIADLSPTPSDKPEAASVQSGQVFISYSRRDLGFVKQLRAGLDRHNVPYWIDQEGLTPGTRNWERAIRAAIQESESVVWVVSPDSYASEYVQDEIAVAELYQRTLYPVWAAGEHWLECVPLGKSRMQYVDMRGSQFTEGVEQLVAALGTSESHQEAAPKPAPDPPPEPRNPYKGLSAFQEADAGDFFGREALVTRLADRLRTQLEGDQARFLAVLGPSGAGKSSVVMAGLLPALKQGALPGSDAWTYLPRIVPGAHPIEHLADALGDVMPDKPLSTIEADLNAPGGRMLHRLARQLPGEQVVLYIDQFEELFTLAADAGERGQFISLLTGAATEPDGNLIVLLSMRADFLDQPLNYPLLGDLFDSYNALVKPMSIAELRDAIEKPANLPDVGLTFDPGLVAEIIFALRGRDKALAGALPLLQFTLERLFEERDGNRLTWDAYTAMGSVEGAIGTHSEAVFSGLPDAAQEKLGEVFLPLVNIDEDSGEPTRRRAPLESVTRDPDAKTLVDALTTNRLLQTGREGDDAYLEIAHEALFRSWSRLVKWIAGTREDLILLRQVRAAAAEWDAKEQPDFLLWPAERLQLVYDMLKRLQPDVDPITEAFIEPEQERLYRELDDITTTHQRRYDIGERLARIGDYREGIGVKDGVPDILWLPVAPGGEIEIEGHRFTVQPFYIAKYLTTYAQFQAFVESGDYDNPRWWQGFPEKYQPQAARSAKNGTANAPRDSISWYQSVAFSRWISEQLMGLELANPSGMGELWVVGQNVEIRLPTEQEWQWAAQNGEEARAYPWGQWDEYPRANTSEAEIGGQSTAVGMYPHGASVCGTLDMAGNLRDWCLNQYNSPDVVDINDSNRRRVLRGGSFNNDPDFAATKSRGYNDPLIIYDFYGVRLVASP